MCSDSNGVPQPGVVVSFWEPYRLIEFERTPGCLSVLNGTKLNVNQLNIGRHEETDVTSDANRANTIFTHYHYYAFPVTTLLSLFAGKGCNPGGYADMDLMYLSEIDPTWSDSEISAFTNPEALLFANPASLIAYPINALFWCAGTWGLVYPISGHLDDSAGVLRATSLFSVRVITQLHRRGFAYKTIGNESLCNGVIAPYLTKSQYKFTLAWPVPETTSDHKIGQLVETWGTGKRIPVTGEDVIYLLWRWLDCCSRY
jgi:conjugal transfer pilus assembly protein TraU